MSSCCPSTCRWFVTVAESHRGNRWTASCDSGIDFDHPNGTWLSLVERCVRDAEAAGSNPVVPTNLVNDFSRSGVDRLNLFWLPLGSQAWVGDCFCSDESLSARMWGHTYTLDNVEWRSREGGRRLGVLLECSPELIPAVSCEPFRTVPSPRRVWGRSVYPRPAHRGGRSRRQCSRT